MEEDSNVQVLQKRTSNEYSKSYYAKNKDKFKLYYLKYKQKKLSNQNINANEQPKKNKYEIEQRKWDKREKKNELKKKAYIELLKAQGFKVNE